MRETKKERKTKVWGELLSNNNGEDENRPRCEWGSREVGCLRWKHASWVCRSSASLRMLSCSWVSRCQVGCKKPPPDSRRDMRERVVTHWCFSFFLVSWSEFVLQWSQVWGRSGEGLGDLVDQMHVKLFKRKELRCKTLVFLRS